MPAANLCPQLCSLWRKRARTGKDRRGLAPPVRRCSASSGAASQPIAFAWIAGHSWSVALGGACYQLA